MFCYNLRMGRTQRRKERNIDIYLYFGCLFENVKCEDEGICR